MDGTTEHLCVPFSLKSVNCARCRFADIFFSPTQSTRPRFTTSAIISIVLVAISIIFFLVLVFIGTWRFIKSRRERRRRGDIESPPPLNLTPDRDVKDPTEATTSRNAKTLSSVGSFKSGRDSVLSLPIVVEYNSSGMVLPDYTDNLEYQSQRKFAIGYDEDDEDEKDLGTPGSGLLRASSKRIGNGSAVMGSAPHTPRISSERMIG
ncbi:hypothetical protein C8Q75DRAFT_84411 [Abortiporus biennis]|nr:hypothetical protein C8Q75DRAFT_84411 [Abortiporus biennis]